MILHITKYQEIWNASKMLDFLGKYQFPKMTQKEVKSMNKPIITEEI